MSRLLFLVLVCSMQIGVLAGVAGASVLDFSDDFDAFDTDRWDKGNHALGRSQLQPQNVSVANGDLRINLPARTLDGGEIRSTALYGHGSYAARMKVPHAPSSITGFFLYGPPDYTSEIDIEIYNDSSRKMAFYSSYAGGAQTHTETMQLPFDPTKGFHEYRFDYSQTSLSFYADGQLMKEWNDGLPSDGMRIYANAWYPNWLEGRKSRKDRTVLIDNIQHTQQ